MTDHVPNLPGPVITKSTIESRVFLAPHRVAEELSFQSCNLADLTGILAKQQNAPDLFRQPRRSDIQQSWQKMSEVDGWSDLKSMLLASQAS